MRLARSWSTKKAVDRDVPAPQAHYQGVLFDEKGADTRTRDVAQLSDDWCEKEHVISILKLADSTVFDS